MYTHCHQCRTKGGFQDIGLVASDVKIGCTTIDNTIDNMSVSLALYSEKKVCERWIVSKIHAVVVLVHTGVDMMEMNSVKSVRCFGEEMHQRVRPMRRMGVLIGRICGETLRRM